MGKWRSLRSSCQNHAHRNQVGWSRYGYCHMEKSGGCWYMLVVEHLQPILGCGAPINPILVVNGFIGSSQGGVTTIMLGSHGVPYYRRGISDAMVHLTNYLWVVHLYKKYYRNIG